MSVVGCFKTDLKILERHPKGWQSQNNKTEVKKDEEKASGAGGMLERVPGAQACGAADLEPAGEVPGLSPVLDPSGPCPLGLPSQ